MFWGRYSDHRHITAVGSLAPLLTRLSTLAKSLWRPDGDFITRYPILYKVLETIGNLRREEDGDSRESNRTLTRVMQQAEPWIAPQIALALRILSPPEADPSR